MKILFQDPPNIKLIKKHLKPTSTTVFTYGDTIYAPGLQGILDNLRIHEQIHGLQQGNNPDKWWDQYILDPEFRVAQEIQAYHAQYEYMKGFSLDRNELAKFLNKIAIDLSGEMYGKVISYDKAVKAIKLGYVEKGGE